MYAGCAHATLRTVKIRLRKGSLVHSADLCTGGFRVRVKVRAMSDRYAM